VIPMRRMPPTEKSDLACLTSFDFDRVTDLNRQEGETISMDYQDLFGLDMIEKCREEAEKSDEVFRSFNLYNNELEGCDRESSWYRSDPCINKVEDLSLNVPFSSLAHISDDLNQPNSAPVHKEYTDLSNKTFIENSLESIRNAIEVNNIPPVNKHIIEQSIHNLQTAITNTISDKVTPIHVNTNHPGAGAGSDSDLVTTFVRTGYQLRPLPDSDKEDDRRWSVIKKNEKVSPISVEEDRVRLALGLPTKICHTTPAHDFSYNPSFSEDRERNTEASSTTIPEQLLPDWSLVSPPQSSLYPSPFSPPGHGIPTTSHINNLPTNSCLSSPYPDPASSLWSTSDSQAQDLLDYDNTIPGQHRTVTKLVPYRIKKIEKENKPEHSQRLTRDERAAKNINIPYTVQYIINCSMEEFNDILNNKSLGNDQIGLCRDIRRRGKNKIAAQNCRKRKIDQISNLEEELDSVRSRKRNLLNEREELMFEHMECTVKLEKFEKFILESLGMGKDTQQWELHVARDGFVEVVEKC